MIVRRISQS